MAGTSYTYGELEGIWEQAGGSARTAPLMAAVALAESGGNPGSVSSTNDWGLWQINAQSHPQWSTTQLLDPATNAQAAVAISSNGTNVGPWCTAWAQPNGNCGKPLAAPQTGSPVAKILGSYTGGGGSTVSPVSGLVTDAQANALVFGHQPTDCMIPFPLGTCLLNYGQGRAILGGLLVLSGAGLMLVGLAAVVAFGLKGAPATARRLARPLSKSAPAKPKGPSKDVNELAQRRANDKALRDAQAAKRASDAREEREGFGPGDRTRRGDEAQRRRTA